MLPLTSGAADYTADVAYFVYDWLEPFTSQRDAEVFANVLRHMLPGNWNYKAQLWRSNMGILVLLPAGYRIDTVRQQLEQVREFTDSWSAVRMPGETVWEFVTKITERLDRVEQSLGPVLAWTGDLTLDIISDRFGL